MAETLSATRGRITAAIQHYLAVLQHTEGGKRATLHELAKALDGLVEAYHRRPRTSSRTLRRWRRGWMRRGTVRQRRQRFPSSICMRSWTLRADQSSRWD